MARRGRPRKHVRKDDEAVSREDESVDGAVELASSRLPERTVREQESVRELLRVALDEKGVTLDRVLQLVADQLDAETTRAVARQPMTLADNDARLRAAEIALKLHTKAGNVPNERDIPMAGSRGRVRIIQIQDDGTRSILEIE